MMVTGKREADGFEDVAAAGSAIGSSSVLTTLDDRLRFSIVRGVND